LTTLRKVSTTAAALAAVALTAAACSSSTASSSATTTSFSATSGCKAGMQASGVAALPGYQVCLFIGSTTAANHPDDVRVVGDKVWIQWQNSTAKDCSTTKPSVIAEYTTSGQLLKSWSVIGHADGMRWNSATNTMWVTSCEDGSPRFYTIDPNASSATQYKVPAASWGGGLDDLTFINGSAYVSASNPSLNSAGINTHPALEKITLSGNAVQFTPVLMGNAKAQTLNPPVSTVTLNLTDADSQTTDPQGDLVMMSQADDDLLFIHNVGTAAQTVQVLSVGTQVDQTVWPTSTKGCLLIADNNSGVFSACSSVWVPSQPLTSSPNDAGVISFVGTLSLSTGQITPIIVGIPNSHGMDFLPK
jgi:hypothetical protein